MYVPKPAQASALLQLHQFFAGQEPLPTEIGISPLKFRSQNRDRAVVVMPCGTGKTMVEYWAAMSHMSDLVVVFSPSQALLSQSSRAWKEQAKSEAQNFDILHVVSEANVDGEITTNSDEIAAFLNTPGKKVVCCTYQSLVTLQEALKKSEIGKIGLVVNDESHRLVSTSEADRAFRKVLDLPCEKMISLTATLRDTEYCDGEKFSWQSTNLGEVVYAMSLSEAVRLKLLTPAEIIPVTFDSDTTEISETQRLYEHASAVAAIIESNTEAKKMIVYHRTVEESKIFAEYLKKLRPDIFVGHVDGYLDSRPESAKAFMEFQKLDRNKRVGVISNSRFFTEGLDLPDVDSVYFAVSKASYIDLTQCSGRAMRLHDGKEQCYIYLPMYNSEEELEASAKTFQKLTNILTTDEIVFSKSKTLASTTKTFDPTTREFKVISTSEIYENLPRTWMRREDRPSLEELSRSLRVLEKVVGNNPFEHLEIYGKTVQQTKTPEKYSSVYKFGPLLLAQAGFYAEAEKLSLLPETVAHFSALYAEDLKMTPKTFLDGGYKTFIEQTDVSEVSKIRRIYNALVEARKNDPELDSWISDSKISTDARIDRARQWLTGEITKYAAKETIISEEFKQLEISEKMQSLSFFEKFAILTGQSSFNIDVVLDSTSVNVRQKRRKTDRV